MKRRPGRPRKDDSDRRKPRPSDNLTDSHPKASPQVLPEVLPDYEKLSIFLSKYKSALINANNSYYNFKPLAQINESNPSYFKSQFDNRYKPPTKEEIDSIE